MTQRICIIEDDEGIRDVLKIILNKAGYETDAFSDGDAIMKNSYTTPDLFLLDKQLTGNEDGVSICRYLKNNNETKEIPVIMMSAFPNTKELSISAFADDFIEKPFMMEGLLAVIKKHIQPRVAKEIPV
jgi:DNA-binding response OmpR family regulator